MSRIEKSTFVVSRCHWSMCRFYARYFGLLGVADPCWWRVQIISSWLQDHCARGTDPECFASTARFVQASRA